MKVTKVMDSQTRVFDSNSRYHWCCITHVSVILSFCLWFCDSVSVSVRTIKPKRLKIKSSNSAQRYVAHQLILDQKVKGQGHRVTMCKSIAAARILEQPRSTARLFQRSCSFHSLLSYKVRRSSGRGVSKWPLSSAYLVLYAVSAKGTRRHGMASSIDV